MEMEAWRGKEERYSLGSLKGNKQGKDMERGPWRGKDRSKAWKGESGLEQTKKRQRNARLEWN